MSEEHVQALVIDAHHHLWRYTAGEFDWIDDRMAALRRDFTPADLAPSAHSADVDATIAVQARQTLEETDYLLSLAAKDTLIAGVVGWLPLRDHVAMRASLHRLGDNPFLVGARHIVQGEPAGFLDDPAFNAGMQTLTDAGLTYDLLLRADQLQEATRFVDHHSAQRFVLDHLAKPKIAAGLLEPWRRELMDLAKREHVCCKLSGMVTEDAWDAWSLDTLRPYLDTAVEAFGTDRLLAGSDWPVCLVASSYERWWTTLRTYFAPFSPTERNAVFGGNAIAFYQLDLTQLQPRNAPTLGQQSA